MPETTERLNQLMQSALARLSGRSVALGCIRQAWDEARNEALDDRQGMRGFSERMRAIGYSHVLADIAGELTTGMAGTAWVWALAAETAIETGEHAKALTYAAYLRERFPALPIGTRYVLECLTALGRTEEAVPLLDSLTKEQAREEWALMAQIAVAERTGAHVAALEAGQALGRRLPLRPEGFLAEVTAVHRLGRHDEAERGIRNLIAGFPQNPGVWVAAAEIAEARGDFESAQQRWAELRKRARARPTGFTGALANLRRANRLDLAPPIIHEGLAKFPDNEALLLEAAYMAVAAAQPDDADLYWQRLLKIRPEYGLAAALCLMCSPVGRPARIPEVLRRLDAHHCAHPGHGPAYLAHLNALREFKQPEAAIEISSDWCDRFPQDAALALARAGALDDAGDYKGALAELTALRARVETTLDIEATYVRALSCAGRPEEADAAAIAALARRPGTLRLMLEYVRNSTRRGDWQQAYNRLLEAQRKLPGEAAIARELQTVRLQLAETLLDAADPTDQMSRFESLGGDNVGCEFGMVQRELGRDAIGLLRWSRNEPQHLIDALTSDFEGVGSEESTILETVRHAVDDEEYVTKDRRFLMESHTFVQTRDAPMDSMFRQTCRRLRFLRGKLLEDLKAGQKIFVYKAFEPLVEAQLLELHAALRRHGDNVLLCVSRARGGDAPGTIRVVEQGLYLGFVGHFLNDGSGKPGSDVASWQKICAQAEQHWGRARQSTAA
jgi:predicted Zn-dependent protease